MLLTESQRKRVAEAIAEVERQTDAELVTVLATRADDYRYIPLLWAALVALSLPILGLALPAWLTLLDILIAQWAVFFLLAAVFRIPAVMTRLVPARVKKWRAASLARRQFLENNLHHTQGETGVLIFVSEAEHYVEILADRGISRHVDNARWQQIVDTFTARVKARQTLEGFLECIKSCGDILCEHAPATHARNELPDHLVVLE